MTKVIWTTRVVSILLCTILISASIVPVAVYAQNNLNQSWKDLSPELRKQKRKQFYSNMPESQKHTLRQNQQKFKGLPGEQKIQICQKFHSQNGYYPPACQSLVGP